MRKSLIMGAVLRHTCTLLCVKGLRCAMTSLSQGVTIIFLDAVIDLYARLLP